MLHGISGIVQFFGRLSFLVDENAHAVHFFIAALLQLLDRSALLAVTKSAFPPESLAIIPQLLCPLCTELKVS